MSYNRERKPGKPAGADSATNFVAQVPMHLLQQISAAFAPTANQDAVANQIISCGVGLRRPLSLPLRVIPDYQPKNCGKTVYEGTDNQYSRDAHREATTWIGKDHDYCCTITSPDNYLKVWKATGPVVQLEPHPGVTFFCHKNKKEVEK